MKKVWFNLLILIILISTVVVGIFPYLFVEKCETLDCFNEHLIECSRATYIYSDKLTYNYNILGIKKGECLIRTKLLFAGLEPRFDSLLNKEMDCSLPLKMIDFPENNLDYCSGKLKEELQYLVIRDLYQYAAQNLGK